MLSLEQKRVIRTRFMQWLYAITNGDELVLANPRDSEFATEYDFDEVQSAIKYLEGENLVKPHWTIGRSLPHLEISHFGVLEVEEGMSNADTETEHFVAFNSLNVTVVHGDLHATQFQQGVSNSNQTLIMSSEDTESAKAILEAIKENIGGLGVPEDVKSELESDLLVVERELLKRSPRAVILRSCFETMRQIIVSASSGIAVQRILAMKWPSF